MGRKKKQKGIINILAETIGGFFLSIFIMIMFVLLEPVIVTALCIGIPALVIYTIFKNMKSGTHSNKAYSSELQKGSNGMSQAAIAGQIGKFISVVSNEDIRDVDEDFCDEHYFDRDETIFGEDGMGREPFDENKSMHYDGHKSVHYDENKSAHYDGGIDLNCYSERYCMFCGKKVEPDAVVCPYCDHEI